MVSAEQLIGYAMQNRISDIHLTEGLSPYMRKNGQLHIPPGCGVITADVILSLADDRARATLDNGQDADFATSFCGGRQRVNIYRESGRLVTAIRLLNDTIPTLEQLKMPPVCKELANTLNGLVLITGPTGSGKSTTLAALIDHVMKTRRCHIITIEDPVEYRFTSGNSLIHQREIGRDVGSFAGAIRAALREDPDVLLVGEMRDYETMSAAITMAETGHLVFSTLHTTGAVRTVERIIDAFPAEAKAQVRTQLSGILRGVMTQTLVPLANGSGVTAASEILIGTDAVLNLIREGKPHQIPTMMQAGGAVGMRTMESHLAELVRQGTIMPETAMANAPAKDELIRLMRPRT